MNRVRVGVVGVGHHGRHHARNLSQMPEAELVGVVDANETQGSEIARLYDTLYFENISDLMGKVDAVCIAVPTVSHYPVASAFLQHGVSVLVEKPFVFSLDEGEKLVSLARRRDARLMVGHIERFNPAWSAVRAAGVQPHYIDAVRKSPFPFRSLDVSVVMDVMIHDIDLAMSLADSEIQSVSAVGGSVLSQTIDWAEARLEFASGQVARLMASRVQSEVSRVFSIHGPEGCVEIDLARRTSVTVKSAMSHAPFPNETSAEARQAWLSANFPLVRVEHDRTMEPIRAELAEFLDAVRLHRDPLVAGQAGLEAVRIASQIERLIGGIVPSDLRRAA